ncbi:tRNA modification GTPase GTPBP3, mitochondrial-like isoform X2 [Liolophura sinensis]|uniref:tRNA modification GTPase GTPBP3, mitochondrial-like isoform X2 n=1 Tax=Liolophura sinensis TaxID=3198878 RepID=UPI003158C724
MKTGIKHPTEAMMFAQRTFGSSFLARNKLRQLFQTCAALSHHDARMCTIFAVSSAPGKAGLAVLRISGSKAAEAIRQLGRLKKLPPERKATLRLLYRPQTQEAIDRGLMLWFPGPRSYTGEDCVEFHVHGGPAVVAAMLEALGELQEFRHAEQGEFTKRAFLNGKLDLTEVEGLADLIEAETESQRKQALRLVEGELGQMYNEWREVLIKSLANVEAFIDFEEEDNIEHNVMVQAEKDIHDLKASIDAHLSDSQQGERLRSGVHVAILGQPNVGKSSLLNAICRRPAAIVSPIAGTTRDVIETSLNIGGYPVVIGDTAGLRDTEDSIEKEGVRRALNRAEQSDLKILVVDADSSLPCTLTSNTLDYHVQTYLNTLGLSDTFLQMLLLRVKELCGNPLSGGPRLTQARHRTHLTLCSRHLTGYLESQDDDVVLAAENLKKAAQELGKVIGKISPEDILDVIFRDFCIGK